MTRRILVDVDGVLADFIGAILPLINDMLGTNHVREDVTEFDFCKSLGLSREVGAAVKRKIGGAAGLAASLEVMPGAIDGLGRLHTLGNVHIVTSPWNSNPTWCHDREAWLLRHFGIPHANVTHTSQKDGVFGDVLVDGKTETCERWRAAWPHGVAVLWSTPHNRRDLWDGPCTNDWEHLADIIRLVPERKPDLSGRLLVAAGAAER